MDYKYKKLTPEEYLLEQERLLKKMSTTPEFKELIEKLAKS